MEEQSMSIRPLSPELCEDWLSFFEKIAFEDHQDWAFCYCLEGHLDWETNEKWTAPEERREKAVELIRTGGMQGYLAYVGDKVIGWCNVNDRENYRHLTEMFQESGYQTEETDKKVKAIYCFLIAPQYRGKGVAQRLLDRVCEDAVREGYACVEGYPFADEKFEFQYHGTAKMYERCGFVKVADLKYEKLMRKSLQ